MPPTAAAIIAHLGLQPHPEGGHFRETFRDTATDGQGRAVSTAIYFLLERGVVSSWHRVDAAEIWHWYAGAPLSLAIAASLDSQILQTQHITIGNDLFAGQWPQAVVPANAWQQARSLGDWTLVGCTVAPSFLFERFEIASDALAQMLEQQSGV